MRCFVLVVMFLLAASPEAFCAPSSFELDLKELEVVRQKGTPAAASPTPRRRGPSPQPSVTPPAPAAGGGWVDYTVRPGDYLFRILMVHFGYTNDEAEAVIPLVREKNGISDIKRLSVGSTIKVPLKGGVSPSAMHKKGKEERGGRESARQGRSREPLRASAEGGKGPEGVTAHALLPAAGREGAEPFRETTAMPGTEASSQTDVQTVAPPVAQKGASPAAEPAGAASAAPVAAPSPSIEVSPAPLPQEEPRKETAPTPPPLVPVGSLIAMAVTASDPAGMIRGIADALQLVVEKNVIIETDEREGGFSIKVPMTLEGNGRTLVVTGATADPFQYTLYRLLAAAGYGVIQLAGNESFRDLARAVIEGLGLPVRYGSFVLTDGREVEADGFLIETLGGRILLTDRPVSGIWSAAERPPR